MDKVSSTAAPAPSITAGANSPPRPERAPHRTANPASTAHSHDIAIPVPRFPPGLPGISLIYMAIRNKYTSAAEPSALRR